jgi:hypothetical protein
LIPDNETASTSTTGSYDISRDEKGFWDSLRDFFFPEEDRYTYAEAMNRGSTMVSVTVDEVQTVRAEDILNEHNTVDIDELHGGRKAGPAMREPHQRVRDARRQARTK